MKSLKVDILVLLVLYLVYYKLNKDFNSPPNMHQILSSETNQLVDSHTIQNNIDIKPNQNSNTINHITKLNINNNNNNNNNYNSNDNEYSYVKQSAPSSYQSNSGKSCPIKNNAALPIKASFFLMISFSIGLLCLVLPSEVMRFKSKN